VGSLLVLAYRVYSVSTNDKYYDMVRKVYYTIQWRRFTCRYLYTSVVDVAVDLGLDASFDNTAVLTATNLLEFTELLQQTK
jgi:hypothetical protein